MASNKRGGLSKGEFQRAQAAKAKPMVKRVPTRSSSKPAPLYGAGPLMPGQKRVANSYGGDKNVPSLVGAGPLLPGQKRVQNSYTGDKPKSTPNLVNKSITKNTNKKSNRSLASKALGLLTGAGTAEAADSNPDTIDYNKVSLQPVTTKKQSGIVDFLGKAVDPFGIKGKLRERGINIPQVPDLGISEALGLNKEVPTGLANYATEDGKWLNTGDSMAMYDYQRFQDENADSGIDANTFINNRRNPRGGVPTNPYSPVQPQPAKRQNTNYEQGNDNQIDTEGYTNDIFNGALTENNPASYVNPADAPLQDLPGGTQRSRSGRGSGLFATGKGVGNPAGPEDEYLSMLRKSMKGYGRQEDDVMRQFKNLIKALDPTYDEYQKEGKDALDKELQRNLTQLAAVMNSNNTGDSEQRAQMMAGLQRDNQNSLGDLVRKLMLQKNEDINKYKSQSVEAVNSVRDKQMSARERYAQALKDYKQQQFENQYKMSSLGSRGGGSSKANYKQVGVDASGQPVFRDFNTGEEWVGNGLKANYDPLDAIYERLGQNQSQGGSWEIDPITNERVWVTNN